MSNPIDDDTSRQERERMVAEQLLVSDRGIVDLRVLDAMREIPRHLFVPPDLRADAYADGPPPIGCGQTISQPYIVALMTECLRLRDTDRVLEIGTGSGYQTAVLSRLAGEVFSVEVVEELAARARRALDAVGCADVRTRCGDGHLGWPEEAPFDAIIVTCSPEAIPEALIAQLSDGGRMVIPVGQPGAVQELRLLEKQQGRLTEQPILSVRFVPMTGGGKN